MKILEEMILLLIQKRHERLKEIVNSNFNEFIFISSVEKYLNKIKPIVDEMYMLVQTYKKEQEEKDHE